MADSRNLIHVKMSRSLVLLGLVGSSLGQMSLVFNGSEIIHEVDATYVNYNIDTGSLYNGMDFRDPKLRALTAQLG